MNPDKHIFALYLAQLSKKLQAGAITISDKPLCSRIITVLRLVAEDTLMLFDELVHARVTIKQLDAKKNAIHVLVNNVEQHKVLNPAITLYQCVTQKSAFEEVVYTATQMGVTRVVPVITAKVQRSWGGAKERERLQKVMIAAAEQSKQFIFPAIDEPIKLVDVPTSGKRIFFSVNGGSLLETLNEISHDISTDHISLLIGSEAGLTEAEEKTIMESGWKPCRLTPTILRAVDAAILGIGSVRSVGWREFCE